MTPRTPHRATWRTRVAAALAALAMTSAVAVAAASPAQARDGSHFLRVKTPGNAQSVFISGRGWTAYDIIGEGYRTLYEQSIDTCYMYTGHNDGADWASVNSGLIAHTNQADGFQSVSDVDGAQRSNPAWTDGTALTVTTYGSRDCTSGQNGRWRNVRVPSDDLFYLWLDLTSLPQS
ncbi:hypothetical protein [Nocardiopsis sp. NRRL B-16309]|uniref:hypothetical protein n=1 Tax=Nocardiopsis sp. NRRL B-16309 TaxID=1519494 RepID=UPI0006ADA22B|nr:hypothetical protein [Nocardiopsis sp. NRRL B-16309]KOX07897.1 hypothetical protein ADL05_28340 [Nocardiopsis sp. NRRL B-16309]